MPRYVVRCTFPGGLRTCSSRDPNPDTDAFLDPNRRRLRSSPVGRRVGWARVGIWVGTRTSATEADHEVGPSTSITSVRRLPG